MLKTFKITNKFSDINLILMISRVAQRAVVCYVAGLAAKYISARDKGPASL
jgi:hypothetical protein